MMTACDPNFVNTGVSGAPSPLLPNGWSNCSGSVDIQPGLWGVTQMGPDGDNFLGFHSLDNGAGERPQGHLTSTLIVGNTYYLRFKFAVVPNPGVFPLWGGGGYGDHPGYLDIYAATNQCGLDEMIGTTAVVSSGDGWVEHELIFTANFAHDLIAFAPQSTVSNWVYMGLDDVRMIEGPIIKDESICDGESFDYFGNSWSVPGTYYHTFENTATCDSIVQVNLSVNQVHSYSKNAEICQGQIYSEGTATYNAPGTYTYIHISSQGCDSVVVVDLSVNPSPILNKNISICDGESHYEGTDTYDTSGAYSYVYPSVLGCDSTINTVLEVNPNHHDILNEQICFGDSYSFQGVDHSASDTVQVILISSAGCDSILELRLVVEEIISIDKHFDLCAGESYVEGSSVYISSGLYTDVYTTVNGCDSVVNTSLDFHEDEAITQSFDICEGQNVKVGSSVYSETGIYYDDFSTTMGCDSSIQTLLTVVPQNPILLSDVEICDDSVHTVNLSYLDPEQIFWSDNIEGNIRHFSEAGTYWVDILLDSCYVSDTLRIEKHYRSPYGLKEITECWGEEVVLQVWENNGTAVWSTGETSDEIIVRSTGMYSAEIENACGSFSYTADVFFEDCDCSVFAPNSFTPNADGFNDQFGITYNCDFIKYEMTIHDRWGTPVFHTEDPDAVWNGEYETEGFLHASNIYNYVITYTVVNAKGHLKQDRIFGHITQIR
ncbi:MAG: T9SS type B sorting domain-containing protein [Flavobacteriales bacterium]|nr:T9SS type B sorting domain-containing protein [Flavobacteriales bacterium]